MFPQGSVCRRSDALVSLWSVSGEGSWIPELRRSLESGPDGVCVPLQHAAQQPVVSAAASEELPAHVQPADGQPGALRHAAGWETHLFFPLLSNVKTHNFYLETLSASDYIFI